MRITAGRVLAPLLCMLLAASLLAGCTSTQTPATPEPPKPLEGTAPNDILTFIPNTENKPIVRIGTQYNMPDTLLIDSIQAAFPDYLILLDYSASAGSDSTTFLIPKLFAGETPYDMIITGGLGKQTHEGKNLYVDLSSESFLDNYLLSALNGVSIEGHVYSIPGTSTLCGIAYNTEMFAEHGWEVPETQDEYFALCEEIKAAGIQPMSACFKYMSAVSRLLTMMNFSDLFDNVTGIEWLLNVQRGEADFKGYFEPVYETAKRFSDGGILGVDIFTASLTQQRQDFWAGKYAMIDYESSIFAYAEKEEAPFEVGLMPYPSTKAGDAGFGVSAEYYISIPASVESDPERTALMKEILAYITSPEGQKAMTGTSLRISNVKGVQLTETPASKYVMDAYEKGNLYPLIAYDRAEKEAPFMSSQQEAVKMIFEGASVEEAIDYTDARVNEGFAAESQDLVYETVAVAEEPFTMLETSYYMADKLREASGAEIGLMLNGGFFRSNLSSIDAGDISSDMRPFVMKGVGAEDWLTTYKLSGAQLKELLERPIVNGDELDSFVASSGLIVEYAPWNERGSRVLSVTLEDGSEIDDAKLYTVAAWAGAIDERYITETVAAHDTLGSLTDILLAAFTKDASIRPDIADRVTLVWPEAK